LGNSSSGILEVPSFKKTTINIGDRQLGRLQAISIINCKLDIIDITKSIRKVYSFNQQKLISKTKNIFYKSNTTHNIIKEIKKFLNI
jgi:GDP/UDP-N,N'-diacetylbacillosamine 2-epimerase (hydrolysing)